MSVMPSAFEGHVPLSSHRVRPRWWLEALAIVWLCWAYDAISELPRLRQVASYDHARSVLHLEQSLHLDPEHALDMWMYGHRTLALFASLYYDNVHFIVTLGVVGWLWWRHPGQYRTLRTSLVLINVIGFIVYWRYPMAPPRLLNPAKYPDLVAITHAFGSWHSGNLGRHANEFAAMPSLHLAWAAWSAYAVWSVFRRHWWAWLVWIYPVITGLAVMSTGNHFLTDGVAGVTTMVVTTFVAIRGQRWWQEWWTTRRIIRQVHGEAAPRYCPQVAGLSSDPSSPHNGNGNGNGNGDSHDGNRSLLLRGAHSGDRGPESEDLDQTSPTPDSG